MEIGTSSYISPVISKFLIYELFVDVIFNIQSCNNYSPEAIYPSIPALGGADFMVASWKQST